MEKEDLNIVFVGHIDHGKSTLIGRLFYDTKSLPQGKMEEIEALCEKTGQEVEFAYLMDHLQEEREQNITIDTAQTFFEDENKKYVIIDAPGHKEFLKNMITGASQAEAAVLIVDTNEGVKEQTKRHAYILHLLGISQVMAVLNKMDKVDWSEEKFSAVKAELSEFLGGMGITAEYYIPISAKKGDNVASHSENMEWYTGKNVLEALDSFKPTPAPVEQAMRFPIQDAYKIDGKRIFVGRVETGKIAPGDTVIVLPSKEKTKIKSIEVWQAQLQQAEAGQSIGITTEDALFIERGNLLVHEGQETPVTQEFRANIFWISKKPMQNGERLKIKCATEEAMCTVDVLKRMNSSSLDINADGVDVIEETEVAEAVIKVEKPLAIERFEETPGIGRFVLERDMDVVGSGIIIKTEA
ncbi:MAG: GTP-binding protein [Candidatus Diapherotrites archaeon]|nr:GTP-binding protein [Candidatus Diapherotrites archaeon]